MNNKSKRPRRKDKSGAAAFEAAVMMPLLLMMAIGFFEFGLHVNNHHVLHNAARQGARTAVFHENSNAEVTAAVVAVLQDSISVEASEVNVRMAKLNHDGTESYTIMSLDENEQGEPVRVIVTVQKSHFTSLFSLFVSQEENVRASAVMQRRL